MKNSKRGISLIAVLMFMLAATTASIIVYKWIGSENFASGARLKMSESEAASNSGLDAVQAWLENKAPDAGILLTYYLSQTVPNPMLVDNELLGAVGGKREQNYQVYLIGADVASRPYKMKFASIGTARDNSQTSKIAVFNVEGLYRLPVPSLNRPGPFNQAFFGQAGTLTDGTEISDAIINGDVAGNVPKITESLVVTGNATFQGGTSATCGESNSGDLYVAGNLKPEANFKVCGNAYVGSLELSSGTTSIFEKDLYINNGNGKTFGQALTVGQNLTINEGALTIGQTAPVSIGGDFAMLAYAATINIGVYGGDRAFSVSGTSWIPGGGIVIDNNADKRVTLNNSGSALYVAGATLSDETDGTYKLYYKNDAALRFRSKGTNAANIPAVKPVEIKEASDLPHLRQRIEDGAGGVEDPIETMDVSDWMNRAKTYPGLCAAVVKDGNGNSARIPGTGTSSSPRDVVTLSSNEFREDDFAIYMNQCYEILRASGSLHNGYLPMTINNDGRKDLKGPFKGNFFFIFTGSAEFGLGSTAPDGKVMLYFPKASNGGSDSKVGLITKAGCASGQTCEEIYNYFILSERNMAGINNFPKITGSVFMAGGTKMDQIQGRSSITFNQELYNSLVKAGILGLTAAGQALLEGGAYVPLPQDRDERYTPLTPRLKVSVESRYTSTETLENLNPENKLKPAVLVMPRIVNLPNDISIKSQGHEIDDYFSVLYLNGLKESQIVNRNSPDDWRRERGITQCKDSKGVAMAWSSPLAEGDYLCAFTSTGTGIAPAPADTFFLRIGAGLGSSKISFASPGAEINDDTPEHCATGTVQYTLGSNEAECSPVAIASTDLPQGWSVTADPIYLAGSDAPIALNVPNPMSNKNALYSFKVCAGGNAGSVVFTISDQGIGCLVGDNPNFTVMRKGEMKASIERIRNASLESRPDCDGYQLASPERTSEAWGAFKINSTAVCEAHATNNYQFECSHDMGYSVSLELNSQSFELRSDCEFISDEPVSVQQNNSSVQIKADIKRKEYALKINKLDGFSGTVTLAPATDTYINLEGDLNDQSNKLGLIACPNGDCEETIYAGVTYNVTISSSAIVASNGLALAGFAGSGINGTITADNSPGIKNLNIKPLAAPSIICAVKPGAQIVEWRQLGTPSEIALKLMDGETAIKDNQDRCMSPQIVYRVSGNGVNENLASWHPVIGSGYKVHASIGCDYNNNVDGHIISIDEKECDGSFEVVAEINPTITCAWGNGNDDYSLGNAPEVTVTITTDPNGGTTCARPTVTGSNFEGLTLPSNWGTASGNSSPYTITANSPLTNTGSGKTVEVQTICNGNKAGTYSAECDGKTVVVKPPCDFQQNWCPGVDWETGIEWGNGFSDVQGKCFFFNGASNTVPNCNSNNNCLINKGDGGYYVYVQNTPTYGISNDGGFRAKPTNCTGPTLEPQLSCTWTPAENSSIGRFLKHGVIEGDPIPEPTVKCDGNPVSPSNISFNFSPWTDPSPYEYQSITASVASGCGTGPKQANCGSLKIRYAPSIVECSGVSNETATLPAKPTQPAITLNDPSRLCSSDGETPTGWANVTWTVSKDGSDASYPDWGSIFKEAGSYSGYNFSGKCGEYPTNLTANCSGNAEVEGQAGIPITIAAGSSGSGTNITAPSGGGQATYTITCTNSAQPLNCNRNSNTLLKFSVNGGNEISQSGNNPVIVMNPCVDGAELTIDFGGDSNAVTCNNRNSYW